jgi:protein SCO1/2
MRMKSILRLALLALGLAACSRAPHTPAPRSEMARDFQVRGVLRAINFAEQTVTVEHEDIPGFMPAMTMPFKVKTMAEVEPLKASDPIAFRLVVNDKTSWIEGVKKIAPGELRLPGAVSSATGSGGNVERLKEGDRLPDFQLLDSKGRPITRATFAGRPLLITFIFTRCPIPNFCPLMTNHFREIQQVLVAMPDGGASLQLLSISFDPEFDTPEVLAQYAAQHTKDTDQWRFATGTGVETKRLTQAFSVSVQPESGTLSHGLATALIGGDGVIRKIWRGNSWQPAEVFEALRAL